MKNINLEPVQNVERFEKVSLSRERVNEEIEFVLRKIDQNLKIFVDTFPGMYSEGFIYPQVENNQWTASFWTGMLWLAYEITGDMKYRKAAEGQMDSYLQRLDTPFANTHDLGFLYTLSCVAAYKLTGNTEARDLAIRAARHLAGRYNEKGKFILAWGNVNDPHNKRGHRMIIDCLMNLPLLYWAWQETGEKKFFEIADTHAKNAVDHVVRDDASTFHTYFYDYETGKPLYGKTHQGYSDDSCWARGQAWGIYGMPLSYVYTKNPDYLEVARRLTNYYLNRLPADNICYWDLIFNDGSGEVRDSSAAAITVCGMLETARQLPILDPSRKLYEDAAITILSSLMENYTSKEYPEANGILIHATGNKPQGKGIDGCLIYADYFYFEALVRMTRIWNLYW